MSKLSTMFLLLRGLGLGLLTAFVNGLSLPILFDLFARMMTALDTGIWPDGPLMVAELWFIDFVFGSVCSLLPGVIAGVILSLGIQNMWIKKTHKKWYRICSGMGIGIAVTVCYVLLLFYVEPVINLRDHGMLVVFILIEQMIIYGWITVRLFTRHQAQ